MYQNVHNKQLKMSQKQGHYSHYDINKLHRTDETHNLRSSFNNEGDQLL